MMKWGTTLKQQKILIVEDEQSIVTLIKYNLEQENFLTDVAHDGAQAIEKVAKQQYDLIILDLMLPKLNGLDVCKKIREKDSYIPILMLTARTEEEDRIKGLNIGADDYITKPFSPKELIARIHAVFRRTQQQSPQTKISHCYTIGDIDVYPERYEAFLKNNQLELTKKEFELLLYFVQNDGTTLSRDELLSSVWNYDFAGDTRIVDVHVGRLREKIEQDTKNPQYIKTVRGFGYKMEYSQ